MTEREQAIKIANLLLERPWTHPDCAEMILARQFLRAIEQIGRIAKAADVLTSQLNGPF